MNLMSLLMLSIGLAMDAFVVSITRGIKTKESILSNCLKCGLCFGFFQGIMTLIGFFIGSQFSPVIDNISHFIVFFILLFIGIKMLGDVKKEEHESKSIFILGIATSIDALSVGLSLAFLKVNIYSSSLLIGIITLVLCFIGVKIGSLFGNKFNKKAEIIGSIILILLAFKVLIEFLITK